MKKIIISRFIFMALGVWLSIGLSIAQERVLTGTVYDGSLNEAMPGATVIIQGTTTGATTDLDGKFQLTVSDGQVIVVSFVGYLNEIITISGQSSVEVKLTPDLTELDEIVVVGYGTQKAKDVTGAVTSVKAEDFNDGNINDPAQLIQGKVAGLSISRPGDDPNASFNIRLRGLSTFGSNTEPLVVVDGVQGVPLNSVDPNDIASMDVLKDASAASIYGTKGAQGVILITTKKGKKGQEDKPVNVEFSTAFTSTTIAKGYETLTASEFREFPAANDFGSETDWMDEITQNGTAQTHNLSIGGATSKSTYRVSLNYRDADGVIKKTGFDQTGGRLNFSQKALNDMLTIDVNMAAQLRNEQYAPREVVPAAVKYNPTAPIYDETNEQYGGYFQVTAYDFYNPVSMLNQIDFNGKKTSVVGSIKGTLEPIEGLKVSGFYSQDYYSEAKNDYYSRYAQFPSDVNGLGRARKESKYTMKKMFEATTAYDKTFGEFNGNIMIGYSWQNEVNEGFWATSEGFISDALKYNKLGEGSRRDIADPMDSWKDERTLIGLFFGRVNLKYKDTYFLTANYRKDGSSMFGEGNKWGDFYGFSGGVDFAKFASLGWLNRAKVRGGYGTTGNLPKDPYRSMDIYSSSNSFFLEGEYVPAYGPDINKNTKLKWEVKKETNIGFDFGLLNYKVTGSVDYFMSKSSDLMLLFTVPSDKNTADQTWLNLGELSNSGIEFAVDWDVIKKGDFSWNTNVNFTKYIDTKLDKISTDEFESSGSQMVGELGAPGYTGVMTIKLNEGESIGQIIGPKYEGIVDGNFTYSEVDTFALGNGLPSFQFGWGNTLRYKQFDLGFFFRGVFGHSIINANNLRYGSPTAISVQGGLAVAKDYMEATNTPSFSDEYVEKGNFITLDNFTFGYTFKTSTSKYISKVRAYVAGQNLFTITKYSGTSPEVRYTDTRDINNPDPLAPGIDRGDTYFRTRSFTFGLNVTF